MRINRAKRTLAAGDPCVGTWLSLCSPIAARFLARLGLPWLTVDLEHSPYDWETAASLFAHIAEADCVPLARVPAGKHDHIKRALDSGAYGIIVPMVMDREEAERCVAACHYPPRGNRSVGGSLHALNFNASPSEYYSAAEREILVILQCEHIEAVRRADEIFSTPGIDAIFVGPNDLRASMRDAKGNDPSPAAFEEALTEIREACQRQKVTAGLHCFSVREVQQRIGEGWRFLALQSDLALMLEATATQFAELGMLDRGRIANY